MLRNYLKVALRSVIRNKGFTFLNVSGLAIGMACCLLIVLWIQDDLTYDNFHHNSDNLHAVANRAKFGNRYITGQGVPPALANALQIEYAGIAMSTRYNSGNSTQFRVGENAFQQRYKAVDPQFLQMFSFGLEKGDSATALNDPKSVIMTRRIANKLFGDKDPIGQTVELDGRFDFVVTGILKQVPENSSLRFNCLIPFEALALLWDDPNYLTQWENWNLSTYVMTVPGADYKELSGLIENRINDAKGNSDTKLSLRPYKDLYLYGLVPGRGRIGAIILFGALGLVILVIACMNFMNLATARSSIRAREIGLRKVCGARKRDIILQFYGEAFVLSVLALVVSAVLVELALPLFNELTMRQLSFDLFTDLRVPLAAIGVTIFTAIIAGSYPALFMSSFKPVKILTGAFGITTFKTRFRKGLVIWQFTMSIALIIVTMVIYKQLDFAQMADVGFDRTDLVYLPLRGATKENYLAFKEQASAHPAVLNASLVSRLPTGVWTNGSGWEWTGRDSETDPLVTYYYADEQFVSTFGVEVVDGHYFTEGQYGGATYIHGDILVNQTFANIIADGDAVGRTITNYGMNHRIIGIVNDFHFKSMHHRVDPLVLFQRGGSERYPMRYTFLFLKYDPDQLAGLLEHLRSVTKSMEPGFPFDYGFLEERYEELYGGIERFGKIIWSAAFMMIFISCLGLFGLAAYTVEQRRREISIRKVLGGSELGLVRLLSLDMLRPVAYSAIAASVLSYLWVRFWLMAQFAYKTEIGWEPFVMASGLAIVVAILSVGLQAIRAARANPADILRHE